MRATRTVKSGKWAGRIEGQRALNARSLRMLSPFTAPDSIHATDAGGRPGRDFAPERAQEGREPEAPGRVNIFEAAAAHIAQLQKGGRRIVIGFSAHDNGIAMALEMGDTVGD